MAALNYRGFLTMVAVPLAFYAFYLTFQKAEESQRTSQQVEALRTQIQSLREENVRFQQEIRLHRTDSYVEKMAREEMGLARPGDNVFLILPMPAPPSAPGGAGDSP